MGAWGPPTHTRGSHPQTPLLLPQAGRWGAEMHGGTPAGAATFTPHPPLYAASG